MRSTLRSLLLALPLAAGIAVPADGAGITSRHLWATVNVCDTLKHADTIGIRGSMPGSDNPREKMYMRFQVQYFRSSDQRWVNVTKGGDSGFVYAGSARFKARQAGQLFTFDPPPGGSFQMRGKVTFQWRNRLGKKVLRSASRITTAGHRSSAGADPAGYSSDTCVIS